MNNECTQPGIIDHDDMHDGDPSIAMRTIRVMFHEERFNYQTQINGKRSEIGGYFRGARLNVSGHSGAGEVIRTPWKIQFVPESEDQPTVVMFL